MGMRATRNGSPGPRNGTQYGGIKRPVAVDTSVYTALRAGGRETQRQWPPSRAVTSSFFREFPPLPAVASAGVNTGRLPPRATARIQLSVVFDVWCCGAPWFGSP